MMRSLRVTMSGFILIEEAPNMLDDVALKSKLPTEGCGAVVSFLGITRGREGDADVLRLEFDAWQEQLTPVLHSLAEQAISNSRQQQEPVETVVRDQPKIGRNEKVTIKNVMSGEEKEVKFKQAIPLLEKGEWVLVNN